MRLTVRLSVREHGYLAALTIAVMQRTLLKGVDWQDAFLPFAGTLSLLLDGLLVLLLAASFLKDVLKRRQLHHLITALTLGLLIGLMQYALKNSEKKKKLAERAAEEAAAMKEVEE